MAPNHRVSWEAAVTALRNDPAQQQAVWDNFYDDPLPAAAKRYAGCPEWAEIRQRWLPKSPGRVLDVGAGRGIVSYALAAAGWRVTALEPDPSPIVGAGAIRQLAARAAVDIAVVEEWGERLPFPDGAFELVVARAVLHHAKNLDQLCNEVCRVLKPGGRFVAAREHVISRQADLAAFLEKHPLHHLYGGENAYRLPEYLTAISAKGKMTITRVLNPFASAINLYPRTLADLRRIISAQTKIPIGDWIPEAAFALIGRFYHGPGRLFTFIADKKP